MADLFEHSAAPSPGIQLNPEQRAAAHHGDGPLVVVAGAGTGKTRVITERTCWIRSPRLPEAKFWASRSPIRPRPK